MLNGATDARLAHQIGISRCVDHCGLSEGMAAPSASMRFARTRSKAFSHSLDWLRTVRTQPSN